jgi:hypothetical protein
MLMGRDFVKDPKPGTEEMREWRKTPAGREYSRRHAEYMREWRKNNPEKSRASTKKSYDKARMEMLERYGGSPPKCACCGETIVEFLSIDHIEGNGAEHRREIEKEYGWKLGGNQLPFWLKRNDYPEGFQVLCYNCNLGKRPHEKYK